MLPCLNRCFVTSFLFILITLLLHVPLAGGAQVEVLELKGVINPPMASYICRGVKAGVASGIDGVVILLDTPGGLDTSMREIVKAIMGAPLPIITYVYPPGARAASAGLFVLEAGNVAAMAPGTNAGAAHPVSIGGKMGKTMQEKVANDALAFLESIARERGRVCSWFEDAVLASSSIPAKEALKVGAIDLIAPSLPQLLKDVEGRRVRTSRGPVILHLAGASVKECKPTAKERILYFLSIPNVAYILAILGFYGLLFELSNPGLIFPGIVGVIFLILSFYSFHTLPLSYAGVFLILFGLGLMILDIKVPSHGLLTAGGVVSFFLGSLMLVDTSAKYLKVSLRVVAPVAMSTVLFMVAIVAAGLRAQLRRPYSGAESLVGEEGVARSKVDFSGGQVFVHGEIWKAVSSRPILPGTKVKVVGVKGLMLEVDPQEETPRGP